MAREQRSAKARGTHWKVTEPSDDTSVSQVLLRGSSTCDPSPPLHKSSLLSSELDRESGRESTCTPSKNPQAIFARLQQIHKMGGGGGIIHKQLRSPVSDEGLWQLESAQLGALHWLQRKQQGEGKHLSPRESRSVFAKETIIALETIN